MLHSIKKLQRTQSLILRLGIWLSIVLVLIGGVSYLIQHGHDNLQIDVLQTDAHQMNVKEILQHAISLTPLGIIELGLLTLVATQLVRVALLAYFYIKTRDYWFTLFSFFILIVLIYSFIWRS